MRKISIYLCAMLVALLFSSCEEDKLTYTGADFVIFDGATASTAENGGAYTITIQRSNASTAITADLTVNSYFADNTSQSAASTFTISTTSVAFAVDEYSASFTVTPDDNLDVDGDKVIELALSSVSEGGVSVGFPGESAFNSKFELTISDNDCVYDVATFIGDFSCEEVGYGTYSASTTEVSATEIQVSGFWGWGPTSQATYTLSGDATMPNVTLNEQVFTIPNGTTYIVVGANTEDGNGEPDGTYESCTGNFRAKYRIYTNDGNRTLADASEHIYTK